MKAGYSATYVEANFWRLKDDVTKNKLFIYTPAAHTVFQRKRKKQVTLNVRCLISFFKVHITTRETHKGCY